MRRLCSAALFLACFLLASCGGAGAPRAVEISLSALPDGEWRVDYRLSAPAARLDLGPSLNGFRARDWRVETAGLRLVSDGGRDYLEPADKGARFSEVSLIAAPRENGFAKQYEPVKRLGAGAVLYTGHFWPYAEDGARYEAVFDVAPASGMRVSAFGETKEAFKDWESPTRHPSFIYAGPLEPTEIGGAHAIVAAGTPDWAEKEVLALAPKLLDYYARIFERELAIEPDLFLSMGVEDEAGVLRYSGDALPGQVEMSLDGGGWREESEEGRTILANGAAHEIAHLWLVRARPSAADAPAWIHEGAADALADEALAVLGVIAPEDLSARLDKARAECAEVLDHGALDAAEKAGRWRASYACGHVLAVIAARVWDETGSVATFWRAFAARAEEEGGYDEKLFFRMIAEKKGADFARELSGFPRTVYAAPDKELAKLLGAASQRPSAP